MRRRATQSDMPSATGIRHGAVEIQAVRRQPHGAGTVVNPAAAPEKLLGAGIGCGVDLDDCRVRRDGGEFEIFIGRRRVASDNQRGQAGIASGTRHGVQYLMASRHAVKGRQTEACRHAICRNGGDGQCETQFFALPLAPYDEFSLIGIRINLQFSISAVVDFGVIFRIDRPPCFGQGFRQRSNPNIQVWRCR